MIWPGNAWVGDYVARVTVAVAIALLVTLLARPSPRVSRWFWAIVFALPIIYLLPLPRIGVPFGEPVQTVGSSAQVFELSGSFGPFDIGVVHDAGPGIWFYGLACAGLIGWGVLAIKLIRTLRLVRAAEQVADPEILSLLYELGQHHELNDAPLLKYSDEIDSPCAWGVTQPVILVPTEFATMPLSEWRLVLDHEMAHVKHGDAWRMLAFAAVRHFFCWNPLIGWAYREALLANEKAIDQTFGGSVEYVQLLKRHVQPAQAGVSLRFRGPSHLLRRIREIDSATRLRPAWTGVVAFASLAAVALPLETVRAYAPEQDRLGHDEILFRSDVSGEFRLWRSASDGRSPRLMSETFSDASMIDVSPDGRMLAYAAHRGGSYDVYIARLDGSEERCVVRTPARESGVSWSPDGTQLLYGTQQTGRWEIGIVDLTTGAQRLVTHDGLGNFEPNWHPNGERFLFTSKRSGKQSIWSMNLDGTRLVQLTEFADGDTGASYSADGRYVLLSSPLRAQYDVYVYDLRTRAFRVLSNLSLTDAGEARFVDGDQAVVMSAHDRTRHGIMRYDLRSQKIEWLGPRRGYQHQPASR